MLKQLFIATALTATSVATFANTGLYVQGDLGASKLEAKEDGEKFTKSTVSPRIAVGQDTGHIRYQGDYTYFGKITNNQVEDGATHNAELSAHSVGFSAIYDFDTKTAFTPYVGVRLGLNVLNFDANGSEGRTTYSESERKVNVGAGVLGGVQYTINPNMALNAGLEYNYLGKLDSIKANQYGANLGLRYNF